MIKIIIAGEGKDHIREILAAASAAVESSGEQPAIVIIKEEDGTQHGRMSLKSPPIMQLPKLAMGKTTLFNDKSKDQSWKKPWKK